EDDERDGDEPVHHPLEHGPARHGHAIAAAFNLIPAEYHEEYGDGDQRQQHDPTAVSFQRAGDAINFAPGANLAPDFAAVVDQGLSSIRPLHGGKAGVGFPHLTPRIRTRIALPSFEPGTALRFTGF